MGLFEKYFAFSPFSAIHSMIGISIGCFLLIPDYLMDGFGWKVRSKVSSFRFFGYAIISALMGSFSLYIFLLSINK